MKRTLLPGLPREALLITVFSTAVVTLALGALLTPDIAWRSALGLLAFSAALTLIAWRLLLGQRAARARLARRELEGAVAALIVALDARNPAAMQHARHTAQLCVQVGRALHLNEKMLEQLHQGALLNDVGKLALNHAELHERDPLTPDEWQALRAHPELGFHVASQLPGLGRHALAVIRYHHERWDGRGYPAGLQGETVPLPARVFAVCAEYDALLRTWHDRAAWTPDAARDDIARRAGSEFDPHVVAAFLSVAHELPTPPSEARRVATTKPFAVPSAQLN